jgi:hypothetical protein
MNKDDQIMTKSIVVLTFGGIIGGRAMSWLMFDSEYDNLFSEFKISIIFLLFLGFMVGLFVKFNKIWFIPFYYAGMWFLPAFRTKLVRWLGFSYGKMILKYWDGGWNEIIGPQGIKIEFSTLSLKLGRHTHSSIKLILFAGFFLVVICSLLLCGCSLYKAWCWSHQEEIIPIAILP